MTAESLLRQYRSNGHLHLMRTMSDPIGITIVTASSAELKGNTVLLTNTTEQTSSKKDLGGPRRFKYAETQAWIVTSDGRLVISVPNQPDIVYVRAPWWAYLQRAAP